MEQQIYKQPAIVILYQITRIKDDCWYSTDQFFFEFPECHQASMGETYQLTGSLEVMTDRRFLTKKRLIISDKKLPAYKNNSFYSWKSAIFKWKNHIWTSIQQPIISSLPYPHSAILLSMIFGIDDLLGTDIVQLFKLTGTSHLQAVSGYNFAVIAAGVHQIVKQRAGKRWQAGSILVAALIFLCIVGVQPSVIRAVGSLITILATHFVLMRQHNSIFYLGLVLYFMLFWHPWWLTSIGFQLSVAAVLGIVLLQPLLQERSEVLLKLLFTNDIKIEYLPFVVKEVIEGFTVGLAASIATAPLILCYFAELPLIGLFISSLFASILAFIVNWGFWTTLAAACLYSFMPLLISLWISITLYIPLEVFLICMEYASSATWFTIKVAHFPWWACLIWYLGWYLVLHGKASLYSRRHQERMLV